MGEDGGDTRQVGGLMRRIQQFGAATEEMFARLYHTLSNRTHRESDEKSQSDTEKRNRKLRKMLRKSSMKVERLEAILSAMSEGLILQNLDGRILDMNAAARDIFGSERSLWQTEIPALFTQYEGVTHVSTELAPLGKPRRMTIKGRPIDAQLAAVADNEGKRFGTLIILREDSRADLSNRVKASFVTHISHELRTPLAPLRLASEILLAAPQEQPPNRRMLEMISRNVDILDRMVNEMIDISAMSTGGLNLRTQPLMLEALLIDIHDEFKDDIADAKLEIRMFFKDMDSLVVNGDRKYLRWAISNVLRNSVQYTEQGKRLYVRCGLDHHSETPRVFVQVADQGVGISEEDQANLFTLFHRGQPRNQAGKLIDPRGLGQGLYVARMITEAHGGEITVQSKVGEGSVFTFYFPLASTPALPLAAGQ
jgi:signal transduction histidine kinase